MPRFVRRLHHEAGRSRCLPRAPQIQAEVTDKVSLKAWEETVALIGLASIVTYKLTFTGFAHASGLGGLGLHFADEWVVLANLLLLLVGFALLSRHFEESKVPDGMPALLPNDWKGGFLLLVIVFVLSAFLDNMAAAIIGATIAKHVYKGQVRIGYLAALVAASNAGGAGSVVGATTMNPPGKSIQGSVRLAEVWER